MRVRRPVFLTVTSGFSAALLLTQACAPRKTVKKTETETPQAASAPAVETSAPAAPAGQSGVESGEASVRGTEFEAVSDLQPAYFAYDAYNLDAAARSQLQKNAGYLKAHPDLEVLATGYCDERGTETYNLALGQRRAKSVREYYIRLGVPEKAIATLSYGKDKPLCSEHNEECWAKNRRTETTVRTRASKS